MPTDLILPRPYFDSKVTTIHGNKSKLVIPARYYSLVIDDANSHFGTLRNSVIMHIFLFTYVARCMNNK